MQVYVRQYMRNFEQNINVFFSQKYLAGFSTYLIYILIEKKHSKSNK